MIEFTCEGCSYTVYSMGMDTVPKHGFCATCAMLREHVPDPEEMMHLYRVLHREDGKPGVLQPHDLLP